MKKSFIVLSLLLPLSAHAQTAKSTDSKTQTAATQPAATNATDDQKSKKKDASVATNTNPVPAASTTAPSNTTPAITAPASATPLAVAPTIAPATAAATNTDVSSTEPLAVKPKTNKLTAYDLKDAGVTLEMDDAKVFLNGSIPKECADRLSLSNVHKSAPTASSEDADTDTQTDDLTKVDDLKSRAANIDVQILFMSDAKTQSLTDCIANNQNSSPVDLRSDPHFSRTVSLSPELSVLRIEGDLDGIKSPEYKRKVAWINRINCPTCNLKWEKANSNIQEALNSSWPSLANAILDGSLDNLDKTLAEAKNLNDLKKSESQLVQMGKYAKTDDQRKKVLDLFQKLQAGNASFANNGKKTASAATNHVEFARELLNKMAGLPGLDSDTVAGLKTEADNLRPGHPQRAQFLAGIDPNHPEVADYLRQDSAKQNDLKQQLVMNGCPLQQVQAPTMPTAAQLQNPQVMQQVQQAQYKFTLCGGLQKELGTDQQIMAPMQKGFDQANAANWNGQANFYQSNGINFNSNLYSALAQPTYQNGQIAGQNTAFSNPQYSNFNASALYNSGYNSGATAQGLPYSYSPFGLQQMTIH